MGETRRWGYAGGKGWVRSSEEGGEGSFGGDFFLGGAGGASSSSWKEVISTSTARHESCSDGKGREVTHDCTSMLISFQAGGVALGTIGVM